MFKGRERLGRCRVSTLQRELSPDPRRPAKFNDPIEDLPYSVCGMNGRLHVGGSLAYVDFRAPQVAHGSLGGRHRASKGTRSVVDVAKALCQGTSTKVPPPPTFSHQLFPSLWKD